MKNLVKKYFSQMSEGTFIPDVEETLMCMWYQQIKTLNLKVKEYYKTVNELRNKRCLEQRTDEL